MLPMLVCMNSVSCLFLTWEVPVVGTKSVVERQETHTFRCRKRSLKRKKERRKKKEERKKKEKRKKKNSGAIDGVRK